MGMKPENPRRAPRRRARELSLFPQRELTAISPLPFFRVVLGLVLRLGLLFFSPFLWWRGCGRSRDDLSLFSPALARSQLFPFEESRE